MVARYLYHRGATAQIVIDLKKGEVVSREVHFNAPTPLAQEEVKRALLIVREKIEELGIALRSVREDDISVAAQSVLDNDDQSPSYAHRLTQLSILAKGQLLGKFLVDLSIAEVERQH